MDVSPASEGSIKKPINDGTRKGRNIYMIDHSLMGKIDVDFSSCERVAQGELQLS